MFVKSQISVSSAVLFGGQSVGAQVPDQKSEASPIVFRRSKKANNGGGGTGGASIGGVVWPSTFPVPATVVHQPAVLRCGG